MWLYTHFLAHCWINSDAEAEWNPKKSAITYLYNSDQMSQFHCCLGYWEYFQARCCLLSTHVSSSVLCFLQTQRSLRAAGKQSSGQGTACCYPCLPAARGSETATQRPDHPNTTGAPRISKTFELRTWDRAAESCPSATHLSQLHNSGRCGPEMLRRQFRR